MRPAAAYRLTRILLPRFGFAHTKAPTACIFHHQAGTGMKGELGIFFLHFPAASCKITSSKAKLYKSSAKETAHEAQAKRQSDGSAPFHYPDALPAPSAGQGRGRGGGRSARRLHSTGQLRRRADFVALRQRGRKRPADALRQGTVRLYAL